MANLKLGTRRAASAKACYLKWKHSVTGGQIIVKIRTTSVILFKNGTGNGKWGLEQPHHPVIKNISETTLLAAE